MQIHLFLKGIFMKLKKTKFTINESKHNLEPFEQVFNELYFKIFNNLSYFSNLPCFFWIKEPVKYT